MGLQIYQAALNQILAIWNCSWQYVWCYWTNIVYIMYFSGCHRFHPKPRKSIENIVIMSSLSYFWLNKGIRHSMWLLFGLFMTISNSNFFQLLLLEGVICVSIFSWGVGEGLVFSRFLITPNWILASIIYFFIAFKYGANFLSSFRSNAG